MLVRRFQFRRTREKSAFRWIAESRLEAGDLCRTFSATGRNLSDVKEFAALVRWCERTGTLRRLWRGGLIERTIPPALDR
jgi:hypothetical protein